MQTLLASTIFFTLVLATNAQIAVPNFCPSHVVQSNFNLSAVIFEIFINLYKYVMQIEQNYSISASGMKSNDIRIVSRKRVTVLPLNIHTIRTTLRSEW